MHTIHFDSIDSTNTYLKNNYQDLNDMTFVSTNYQSAGKGRNNRSWLSNKNENIMFSLLIKDELLFTKYQQLSIITAYSILKVLEKYNLKNVSIKWPNDVYVSDKKICGILLEAISVKKMECLIIGVGLNVNQKQFIGKYIHEPTSLAIELNKDTDIEILKNIIYKEIINNIDKVKNDYDFYQDIKKYDYLKNRNVNAFINNEVKNVICEGINEDYTLTIKYDDKQIRINSGEISFHA